MTPFVRCLNLVALVLVFGLDLGAPANVVAAPVCVSRDEVGMAGAASMQLPGGVGGTGARTGGMGGTGAPLQQRPGGTGGTGAPIERPGGTGGTGIVGTITGFASICVNGQEVHYAKDVPVSENGAPASSAHLAIGQVVAVEAYGTQRGLQAGRIAILNVYEGPLTALPNASGPLRVMGQPVRLAAGARVAEGLRPGEPVRVSGLRDAAGEVVASRIERAPGLSEASAIGAIDHPGSLQGLKLGIPVAPAREMLVRGQWTGSQLEVAQTRPDPSLAFAGRGQTMVIEGLVQRTQARQLVVGGINVTLGQDTVVVGKQPASIALDQRVRVIGVFSATHELRASRVELDDDRAEHSGAGRSGVTACTLQAARAVRATAARVSVVPPASAAKAVMTTMGAVPVAAPMIMAAWTLRTGPVSRYRSIPWSNARPATVVVPIAWKSSRSWKEWRRWKRSRK